MSKNHLSEQQLQLWQQVAGLFSGSTGTPLEIEPEFPHPDPGEQIQEPVMPEEESGVAEASAVAEAAREPAEPAPEWEEAPLTQPGTSASREETIRMIGEAIDVQTDFPGFDEVEKPAYLSEDLHHLLKKEDTEESLETMTEEGFPAPWAAPEEQGVSPEQQNAPGENAMPLPDDLKPEDREGQAPPPQEGQDIGQLNHPLQEEQAPEQVDVPPAEASEQADHVEPNLEEEQGEADRPEPELASEPDPGWEEPSPRAFPQAAPEAEAPAQSGLPDIMQRATMQALRSARETAARQSTPPDQTAGEQPRGGFEPVAPEESPADPQERPVEGDFLNDPRDQMDTEQQAPQDEQMNPDQPTDQHQGDSGDDNQTNNPFQAAPWGS